MRIAYHPEARRELLEAGLYYLAVGGDELHQGFEAEDSLVLSLLVPELWVGMDRLEAYPTFLTAER